MLVGHAHEEIAAAARAQQGDAGKKVLLTEPLKWGMRLSVMDFDLEFSKGRWTLAAAHAHLLNANTVPEDPEVAELVREDHAVVRTYVNSVIGTCTIAMSAATARFEDTAAIDFINHVQADAVKAALAGTPDESLPVLSIAAPFNRDAAIPAGNVTVRDVAGLYIYDNTLLGIRFTGAQVKAYLEYSAAYFKTVTGAGPFAPDAVTNAATAAHRTGARSRTTTTTSWAASTPRWPTTSTSPSPWASGSPTSPTPASRSTRPRVRHRHQQLPPVRRWQLPGGDTAPVLYNAQVEIRQLLIDWTTEQGVIDPTTFTTYDWKLVSNGQPVVVEGAAEGGRH